MSSNIILRSKELRFRGSDEDEVSKVEAVGGPHQQIFRQLVNADGHTSPTLLSSSLVDYLVVIYAVFSLCAMVCVVFLQDQMSYGTGWSIFVLCFFLVVAVSCVISITLQPKSKKKLYFMVPFVPVIPALSLMLNLYLMLMLDPLTWVRFGVWLIVGLLIYFLYGMSHSKEGLRHLNMKSTIDAIALESF